MKLNVFGRLVEVARSNEKWIVFYLGNEGKKREANDIVLPSNLTEADIAEHIADLCHEWATPKNGEVKVL